MKGRHRYQQTHTEEAHVTTNANKMHMCMAHDTRFFGCVCFQERAGEEDVQAVRWRSVPVTSKTDQRGDTQKRYKMAASSSLHIVLSFLLSIFNWLWRPVIRVKNNEYQAVNQPSSIESVLVWLIAKFVYVAKTLSAYSLSDVRINCLTLFQTIVN